MTSIYLITDITKQSRLQLLSDMKRVALHIVVAISSNRVIGKEGGIPWYLPEDLRMFKELTLNHPVLMGRKTFFSIISQLGKPLPQRYNLVLTKDKNVKNDIDRDYSEVEVFSCFEEAIMWAKQEDFEKIFVIGGEKIYRESLPSCEEIFLTEVDANFDGDTFFPEIEWDNWIAIEKREWALAKSHGLRYRFCHFKRRN